MTHRTHEAGQTLVALLVFMMAAMTLTLSATMIMVIRMQSDIAYQNGEQALQSAQLGIENALIRLERDTTYAGETMTLTTGTATITISGTTTKTIVSAGASGNAVRTITASVTITNGILSLASWSETP